MHTETEVAGGQEVALQISSSRIGRQRGVSQIMIKEVPCAEVLFESISDQNKDKPSREAITEAGWNHSQDNKV